MDLFSETEGVVVRVWQAARVAKKLLYKSHLRKIKI